ncbi:MAG: hypothetical protein K6B67_00870 [Lachnospiraceae bacterium]|nr:hypothetical protein [Lachnospiraceae bacterium]
MKNNKKRILSAFFVVVLMVGMAFPFGHIIEGGGKSELEVVYNQGELCADCGDEFNVDEVTAEDFKSMSNSEKEGYTNELEQRFYGAEIRVLDEPDQGKLRTYSKRYNATSSYWDQFGSRYYYNQMSASKKAVYDALYSKCMNILLETGDTGVICDGVPFSGITPSEAIEVAYIFENANPQFYFLDDSYAYSDASVAVGIDPDFANGEYRRDCTNTFKNEIEKVTSELQKTSSWDEEMTILNESISYNNLIDTVNYASADYDQSCYSAIVNKVSVCAGYSEAFELYCNYAGIDCIVVTSSNHEWNQVRIGDYWYLVDVTFADTGGEREEYFNVSEQTAGADSHAVESLWSQYNRPPCNYNYGSAPEVKPIYGGVDYSAVYNYNYYISKYGDLQKAFGTNKQAALEHFVKYGMSEGRQAKSSFNVQSYKNRYADLRNAYGNNLKEYYLHYINYGKNEGRITTGYEDRVVGATTVYNGANYSAVYDYDYYVQNNRDVYNAYGTDDIATLSHFVNYGMNEGRQAKSSFNVQSYKNRYADLRNAYGDNTKLYYLHYINFGKNEGRNGQ